MRVEVINTGTELLLGQVTNSHLSFLAQSLFALGLRVERQITVPDGPAITEALRSARERGGLILITGGLGPTSDDLTREAAAAVFNRGLHFHPEVWAGIEHYFTKSGFKINELQKAQAMVPEGGHVMANPQGTAPGLILDDRAVSKSIAMLFPGPPRELKPMWVNEAMPWLKANCPDLPRLHERQIRILGVGESRVQLAVEEAVLKMGVAEVGYCARPGEVDLRLIASNAVIVEEAADFVRATLSEAIYGEGAETMEEIVVRLARARRKSVATAESCTGGFLASRLTNIPHASEMFRYGWVTYANEAKITELGVLPSLLETHGAVSDEVAQAMAEGALHRSGADIAVAVTGIAGPNGATEKKPIGRVYFGLATRKAHEAEVVTQTLERTLSSDRETFKYLASQQALNLVRLALLDQSALNSKSKI